MPFIFKTKDILNKLNSAIIEKNPFSMIRFGDGGLKMMYSIYHQNKENIKIIGEKEGIPYENMKYIITLWAKYANTADFIDTPSIYDGIKFWKRYKKGITPINCRTQLLLNNWKNVYSKAGISTEFRQYCNPEFNWLSILNNPLNLLNIMKNKKICFISIFDNISNLSGYDIKYVKIVNHYENHFKNSFSDTITYIEENVNKYDLWLNSSGELGRIYSGRIKELGGRVLDMGFVAQYWNNLERPLRFSKFMEIDKKNPLQLQLTKSGLRYKDYI